MTINVTAVNDAPAGTNNTVTALEDGSHQFTASEFGFTDADGNALQSVTITNLPGHGVLTLNGVAVTEGQEVSLAQLTVGAGLVFTPVANANGDNYANFSFQVKDDGGTANGGANLDLSANTMTINVTAVNDAPAVTFDSGNINNANDVVYESGLAAGGHAGGSSYPTTAGGNFELHDADGQAQVTSVLINGTSHIISSLNGLDVAGAHGTMHFSYDTTSGKGSYTYTLTSTVTGAAGAGTGENTVNNGESFTLSAVDSANVPSSTASINFNIVDDVPIAHDISRTGQTDVGGNTNLLLVLDISGSMAGVGIEAMKNSTLALLDQYDALGTVNVRIVEFGTDAYADTGMTGSTPHTGNGWMSVADARAVIYALAATDNTNFDAALLKTMDAFGTSGKIEGAQNVGYFVSDGNPNVSTIWPTVSGNVNSSGIQSAEEVAWRAFLNTNDIRMFALGLGSNVTLSKLNPIAWDGSGTGTGTNMDATQVGNISQLGSVLTGTLVAAPISGNLLTDASTHGTFGADGGWVNSVKVGTHTYTFDQATGSNTNTGTGTDVSAFNSTTHEWTIATQAGGSLRVDMDSGDYVYTPSSTLASGTNVTESVGFTLHDNDGDVSNSQGMDPHPTVEKARLHPSMNRANGAPDSPKPCGSIVPGAP